MKIAVKKEVTNYVDEEMKVYFKTLDLLDNSIWALNFNLVYKDGYFDIDINSIKQSIIIIRSSSRYKQQIR